jgi:hypothetical protein
MSTRSDILTPYLRRVCVLRCSRVDSEHSAGSTQTMNSEMAHTVGVCIGVLCVIVGLLVPWCVGVYIIGGATWRSLRKERAPH